MCRSDPDEADHAKTRERKFGLSVAISTLDVATDLGMIVQWFRQGDLFWAFILVLIFGFANCSIYYFTILNRAFTYSFGQCRQDRELCCKEWHTAPGNVAVMMGFGSLYFFLVEMYSRRDEKDFGRYQQARQFEVLYESLPSAFLQIYVIIVLGDVTIPTSLLSIASLVLSVISIGMGAITHVQIVHLDTKKQANTEFKASDILGSSPGGLGVSDSLPSDDMTDVYFGNFFGVALGTLVSFADAALRIVTVALLASLTGSFRPVNFMICIGAACGGSVVFLFIKEKLFDRENLQECCCTSAGWGECKCCSFVLHALEMTAAGFFMFEERSKLFWGELVFRHLVLDWVMVYVWLINFDSFNQQVVYNNFINGGGSRVGSAIAWRNSPSYYKTFWLNGVILLQGVFWLSLLTFWGYTLVLDMKRRELSLFSSTSVSSPSGRGRVGSRSRGSSRGGSVRRA